jgi:hypothetical protein
MSQLGQVPQAVVRGGVTNPSHLLAPRDDANERNKEPDQLSEDCRTPKLLQLDVAI